MVVHSYWVNEVRHLDRDSERNYAQLAFQKRGQRGLRYKQRSRNTLLVEATHIVKYRQYRRRVRLRSVGAKVGGFFAPTKCGSTPSGKS